MRELEFQVSHHGADRVSPKEKGYRRDGAKRRRPAVEVTVGRKKRRYIPHGEYYFLTE